MLGSLAAWKFDNGFAYRALAARSVVVEGLALRACTLWGGVSRPFRLLVDAESQKGYSIGIAWVGRLVA